MKKYCIYFLIGEIIIRIFPIIVIAAWKWRGYYAWGGEWLLYLFSLPLWVVGYNGIIKTIKQEFFRQGKVSERRRFREKIEKDFLDL